MTSATTDQRVPFWKRYAERLFGIDPRSLALFRIGLGSLLLADLAVRLPDLRAICGGDGILSIPASKRFYHGFHWSVYWASGDIEYQMILFAVAAIVAVALLLGYHTRLATIVSWAMLCSLHVRMPLVLNGGDTLLRCLLFWSMFLPLGKVWSADAQQRPLPDDDRYRPVLSVATVAVMLQLCLVYWFAGWSKCNTLWLHGDALSYVLSLGMYTRPLASSLLEFPTLLHWASIGTVCMELAGPLLLFIPWRTPFVRLLLIAAFACLHLGIEATLYVGMFSYVTLIAWCVFLPRCVWTNAVAQGVGRRLAAWFPPRQPDGAATRPGTVTEGRWRCWGHIGLQGVCGGLLVLVVLWNFSLVVDRKLSLPVQTQISPVMNVTMLGQSWPMFDRPWAKDAWFVYEARLRDGRVVDLLRDGAPVCYEEPSSSGALYSSARWRKLHANLLEGRYRRYRRSIATYLWRQWNESHAPAEQVVEEDVYCFWKAIGPNPPPAAAPIRQQFARVRQPTRVAPPPSIAEVTSVAGREAQ